jgi:hypothetical protein
VQTTYSSYCNSYDCKFTRDIRTIRVVTILVIIKVTWIMSTISVILIIMILSEIRAFPIAKETLFSELMGWNTIVVVMDIMIIPPTPHLKNGAIFPPVCVMKIVCSTVWKTAL